MRLLLAGILALSAASCSRNHRFDDPATLSFKDSFARAETWYPLLVENWHLHPARVEDWADEPQGAVGQMMKSTTNDERMKNLAEGMDALLEDMMNRPYGKSYGGPRRLTLLLRHYPPDSSIAQEEIFVVTPALAPEETSGEFSSRRLIAGYHRAPVLKDAKAELESGTVRIRRLAANRYAYEIRLTLKPCPPDQAALHLAADVEVSVTPK